MNASAWSFLILPGLAAIAVGWSVRTWVAAILSVVVSYLLLLMLTPLGADPTIRQWVPLITGAGLAAIVLTFALFLRPSLTRPSRITLAVILTVAGHGLYLWSAFANR